MPQTPEPQGRRIYHPLHYASIVVFLLGMIATIAAIVLPELRNSFFTSVLPGIASALIGVTLYVIGVNLQKRKQVASNA